MTLKEIMEALLAGKKLHRWHWIDDYIHMDDKGRVVDRDGNSYAGSLVYRPQEWSIFERKLTDEELIAEWEFKANGRRPDSQEAHIYKTCARQLKDRKL